MSLSPSSSHSVSSLTPSSVTGGRRTKRSTKRSTKRHTKRASSVSHKSVMRKVKFMKASTRRAQKHADKAAKHAAKAAKHALMAVTQTKKANK